MLKQSDINALILELTDFQKDLKIEAVLEQALAAPQLTEDRLRQIEQILETFKGLGLLGGDGLDDLDLLLMLGHTYERMSHLEKAFETYQKALDLAERYEAQPSRAKLLSQMGRVLTRWQRWDEALDCLTRAQRAYEALGDDLELACTIIRQGTVCIERGDYEGAREVYEQARKLGERIGNRKTIASVTNNMAILATIQGDLDEAVQRYEACIPLYQALADDRGLAGAYQNMGMAHVDRQDWTRAMDAYECGFEAAEENGHLDIMATVHLNMSELMLEMGNSVMVPYGCARALDVFRKLGDRLGEADVYRLLGRTFALRQDWEIAAGMFQDSLQLCRTHGNPLGVAEAYRDLGRMRVAQGHVAEAREALETALEGFRMLGARVDVKLVETLLEELDAPRSEGFCVSNN